MTQFPKKYNYKNIKLKKIENNLWTKIYSRLFPGDQKIHPGCLYSMVIQDYYSKINSRFSDNSELNIGFWLSSKWYSKLNSLSLNLNQLQLDLKKQSRQNIKFIDKLWFDNSFDQRSSIFSEDFNVFLRKVFVDLYKSWKISNHKEVVARSKDFQTNVIKNNLKIETKEVKEFVLKYFIESKWITILIPTINIETIFSDVAVAVNPQDKRYKKLIWQNVIIPIINKSIPIIWEDSVDSFSWTWVVRINPWHDEYWLKIAQKHSLPTNIFAIDTNWMFTDCAWEFSNKPVKDFLWNIIKYIDDIWNLDSTKSVQYDALFDCKSGEELYTITLDQRNIKYDYAVDYLINQIEDRNISIYPIDKVSNILWYLRDLWSVNISNKSIAWVLIPILQSKDSDFFVVNQDILIEKYNLYKSNKNIVPALIVLNLILDNQLNDRFSVEEIIDVLFDFDFWNQSTKISKYIGIYDSLGYGKWLKDLENLLWKMNDDIEKISLFSDMLENSFAIKKDGDLFYLDFSEVFWVDDSISLQRLDSFSKEFIDCARFLYKEELGFNDWSYSNIKHYSNTFIWAFDEIGFPTNLLLLWLEYSKTLMFSELFFYLNLVDQKWNKINNYNSKFLTKELSEVFEIYWSDLLRLIFLTLDKIDNNISYDIYKIADLNSFINKVWNANRYIYNNYFKTDRQIGIDDLINNKELHITDYDNWILHSLKSLVEDIKYQLREKKIMDIPAKILNFISNDLCDKYIEAIKIYNNKNTNSVALFSFIVSFKLLKPFCPFFIQELEDIFYNEILNHVNYNITDVSNLVLKDKNYKINIFMDIINKLRNIKLNLWVKKHEKIDVFVQANPEFLSFLSENEDLFRVLLNTWDIDYIRLHEDIPVWYDSDNVININIGAKKMPDQIEVTKDVLVDIQNDLETKREYLQHMKSLIVSIIWTAPIEIITKKKQEIQSLQLEIEDLELSLNKLKMKN